jgi:hypothetical protein
LSIESAHCYADWDSFFQGVSRILKEDGTFIFVDFKLTGGIVQVQEQLTKYFDIVKHQDIKEHVVRAMTSNSDKASKVIEGNYPWHLRYFLQNMSGVKNSYFFNQMSSKDSQYFCYQLRKRTVLKED